MYNNNRTKPESICIHAIIRVYVATLVEWVVFFCYRIRDVFNKARRLISRQCGFMGNSNDDFDDSNKYHSLILKNDTRITNWQLMTTYNFKHPNGLLLFFSLYQNIRVLSDAFVNLALSFDTNIILILRFLFFHHSISIQLLRFY